VSEPKVKAKMGRPLIPIEWKEFDSLCALQCTLEEIAGFYHCSIDTIERRVNDEKGMTFAEYYQLKRGVGKVSLRRTQFRLAHTNPALSIWLGKQWLGQKDEQNIRTVQALDANDVQLLQQIAQDLIDLRKPKLIE
jgi:AraC-like DNA-binding protein